MNERTLDGLLHLAAPELRRQAAGQPSAESDLELSILMPCLNESQSIAACVLKAQEFLQREGVRGEVVVADNGSTDGSQAIAENLGARVVPVASRGYGAALYEGTLAARGRFVIMGDSDDTYDFSDLRPFLDGLRQGFDMVVGNRFRGEIRPGAMSWKNRHIGNPALSGIGQLLFHSAAKDFHCGLRGFTIEAFRRMDLRTVGMEYASEMVVKATLHGLKITEVPITLSPDHRGKPSHLRPWRDGWRHLRFMLLFSPRWLFLYPGIFLMAAGALLMAWLLPGGKSLFGVTFDVHTILYGGIAILIGAQSVAFAVLTKSFAIAEGLLPPDPRFFSMIKVVNLEVGITIGGAMFLAGLAGSVFSVVAWGFQDFGALDARQMLRLIVPSVTALALGVQIVLFSFFASVLGLKTRKAE
jgi:glycosyltransferase involved in cell wall biosynthesis